MASIDVLDATGAVQGSRDLPEDLFGQPVNSALMHQVVVAGAAAQRAGTHSTKGRGDVRGGGKKPWRQKGTGRARQGSIRAPHWMGGGVAHGPHPRSYELRVNRKMKKAALRSALSDAASSGKLVVIDRLAFEEPRTREAAGILSALGLGGRVLLVLHRSDEVIERSFRNLAFVKIDYAGNLNTYDVLLADRILFTGASLDVLEGNEPAEAEPEPRTEEPAETSTSSEEPVAASDETPAAADDDQEPGDEAPEDTP